MRRNIRLVLAGVASIPISLALAYFGLIAGLSIVQEALSNVMSTGQTLWTAFLNPLALFGLANQIGDGTVLDQFLGGPGASAGYFNRYVIFMFACGISVAAYYCLVKVWSWAKGERV